MIRFFADFYEDFESARAYDMLSRLNINPAQRMKTMSKGTKEKVQLILVMSRRAKLYLLDEPIGGVESRGPRFYSQYHHQQLQSRGKCRDFHTPDLGCGKDSG